MKTGRKKAVAKSKGSSTTDKLTNLVRLPSRVKAPDEAQLKKKPS